MTGARWTGDWCGFRWFQTSGLSLGDLVEAVPDLVRERFVVVTSLDSGPLRLADDELAAGWRQVGSLAVSPKSPAPWSLPRGGWDEWYVFEDAPPSHAPEVFVNYGGFSLRPDTGNEGQQSAVERFWGQLAEWWPESYLAEGDNLICVTRQETVATTLARYFAVDS
ncbi:hypothetical protein [Frigoriglobus tundricola]|uniref:Uncharacterized protein n=1 Tax=Frigoriglobus tundricola TaxID=2774151 RepID=A0A6M5Z245_9BACT|nr:hypothetical protein [Frigoriglobus tundricola]QJX00279.1 hypothetical protein FTUN_7904 [Frigoriglobus tundricola]